MSTPEGHTKAAIKRMLEAFIDARAPVWYCMPTPAAGSVGLPDFLVCAGGTMLVVEAKAMKADGGGAPTKLQQRTMAAVEAAEGHALLVQEEPDYFALHAKLGALTGYAVDLPPWRSEALRKRKAPPK